MSNETLLANFVCHRDQSAFEALIRQHGPMVLRVCRDILDNREQAEDAFQATFLVLLRRAGSIREHGSLDRWLYGVACRISRRERRRLAKLRSQERQVPAMDSAASPDLDPADREWKPILHEEIGRLPAKLRDAIVLCYLEDLTVETAARRLGCPVGTLKSRLGKAREVLRSRLTRRGLAASAILLLMVSLTEESSAAPADSLLENTIKATSVGNTGNLTLSDRVIRMVLQEEARTRWVRLAASLSVLSLVILAIGLSPFIMGRKAQANPLSSFASAIAISTTSSPAPPQTRASSGIANESHCQSR